MNILCGILIGLVAGVASGLFGIGGGVIMVPAMVFCLGFSQHLATGTSLGALLLPVGLLGVYEYYQRGQLDWRVSLWIALGLVVGIYCGAKLTGSISSLTLKRLFGGFIILMGMKLIFSRS